MRSATADAINAMIKVHEALVNLGEHWICSRDSSRESSRLAKRGRQIPIQMKTSCAAAQAICQPESGRRGGEMRPAVAITAVTSVRRHTHVSPCPTLRTRMAIGTQANIAAANSRLPSSGPSTTMKRTATAFSIGSGKGPRASASGMAKIKWQVVAVNAIDPRFSQTFSLMTGRPTGWRRDSLPIQLRPHSEQRSASPLWAMWPQL